jgi:cytosine/adenosine deaminase-related metal-dependent hydrolase
MPANLIYQMAVVNNRDLVKTLFGGLETGIIKTGAKADLILVDYKPYTEMNADNFPWHVVFGFRESAITTTIVNGKILMKDRKILCLDEEAAHKEALEISKSVWKNYHKQFA